MWARCLTVTAIVLVACGDRVSESPGSAPSELPASELPASSAEKASPTDAGAAAFVGRAACAGCHPAEAERWRGSHHDLAMQEAGPATVLGDFDDTELEHFGAVTRFSRRGGAYRVSTEGPDGEPVDLEVAYTFGVEPLQQYLVPLPGGRLQALPTAWDTRPAQEGGQRWLHLYPEDPLPPGDPLHWAGPNQNWNHMCAECHSTQLRKRYVAEEDRYDTTWEELDVSCEACHGPGSCHLEWARLAGEGGEAGGDRGLVNSLAGARGAWSLAAGESIAARAGAADRREVETCARCHSRRGMLSEDYEFGRPLLDTHRLALLEEGLYHADGQILDEVYVYGSFLQSAMYAAGVSCSDCHDPHSLEVRGGVDTVCESCHRAEVFAAPEHHGHRSGSAGSRCVACHMPERVYMEIDARRDHRLSVPRPELSLTLGVPNACQACHAERDAAWAAEEVARWRGDDAAPRAHFAAAIDAGRRRLPGASRALARVADDRSLPGIVRATALELLGQQPQSPPEATLETAAGNDDPLLRMAAARAAEVLPSDARVRLAAPLLRDELLAVRVEAARVLADVPPAQWPPGERVAQATALAEYLETLRVDADRPEAQLALGLLHARRGDLAQAERAYLRALEIAPGAVPTRINLADLHRMQGREDAALRVLREGLALAPDDDADLEHALGLALVRSGRREEAVAALGRAAALAPERPRYAYVYAVALAGEGEGVRALAVLEEAHRRHPGERDLLLGLATFSRDSGDLDAARRWARELVALRPSDREARALLDSLAAAGAETRPQAGP